MGGEGVWVVVAGWEEDVEEGLAVEGGEVDVTGKGDVGAAPWAYRVQLGCHCRVVFGGRGG